MLLNQYFLGQLNSRLSFLDTLPDFTEQQDQEYLSLIFRPQFLHEYGHVLLKAFLRYQPKESVTIEKLQYLLKHSSYNQSHFHSKMNQIEEIQTPYQTKGATKLVVFEKLKGQVEETMRQILDKEGMRDIVQTHIHYRQHWETLDLYVDLQEGVKDQLMQWVFYQFQIDNQGQDSAHSEESSYIKNESEESKELRRQLQARQVVYLLYPRNIHQL